jgi:hypothetical protein
MTRTRSNIVPIGPDGEETSNRLKYDPDFCMQVRVMATEGKFPETWCAEIGVTMQTMWNWANKYPEFDEAYRIAWHILHAVWTQKLADNINTRTNQAMLIELLRKRFPATYGNVPRNTLDAFEARNDPPPQEEGYPQNTPGEIANMPDDDLHERIKQLQARREHDAD